ncbi:ABC transporter permease [Bacillus sp. FSL W8-1127]|jgi:ABC-2 type transport system permease protein|uniref:ABC transporter permease n=1 Tax=unclassified Bacillus (in: firmicutes) TaxID=185979 RepID=UPI0030F87F35
MKAILLAKWQMFLRKPWGYFLISVICVGFAFIVGKANDTKMIVPVASQLNEKETKTVLHEFHQFDLVDFRLTTEKDVQQMVGEGKAEAGIILSKDHFRLVVTSQTGNVQLIKRYAEKVQDEYFQNRHIKIELEKMPKEMKERVLKDLDQPLFQIKQKSLHDHGTVIIDPHLQSLFGFALFFVIYTIAFQVVNILQEKKEGIWDRMIFSPIKKWQMYTGNLLFCFVLGYIQVLMVFSVFYAIGVDFYGGFAKTLVILIPYVFSVVALSIFLTGICKSVPQFRAILQILAVSMAMVGGAYWPIEIVSSQVLLAISKFVPVTYAMQALKEATIYHYSFSELLYPISILFMMGVVLMGIGINLMERRHV